ncbi:hypothetical protein LA020_002898 [Vibrio alginolyticus]|nr:hypothetical protein [Vibrio alginolyticus]
MKNLIGAGVTLHLNNADNTYSKMNKANCAACTIQTNETKLNVYLNHATKGANERGQAVPFSHYLKQLSIVKTSHGAFRKDLNRKLPTLDELYYGHTETTLYHVFVVLDMTLLALGTGEAQLFVIVLSKTDSKDFGVFTPRRMIRFNQQDKFGSKLIKAPMFDKKSREEKIIQAAKKEEAIEHCNEKFELEMENEMLKQKLAELQSRDQEQVAKISDLTEVVQAVSTELEELKASIKRMQQDAS